MSCANKSLLCVQGGCCQGEHFVKANLAAVLALQGKRLLNFEHLCSDTIYLAFSSLDFPGARLEAL